MNYYMDINGKTRDEVIEVFKEFEAQGGFIEFMGDMWGASTGKEKNGYYSGTFLEYLENIKSIKETKITYLESLRDYHFRVASLEKTAQLTPNPETNEEEVL